MNIKVYGILVFVTVSLMLLLGMAGIIPRSVTFGALIGTFAATCVLVLAESLKNNRDAALLRRQKLQTDIEAEANRIQGMIERCSNTLELLNALETITNFQMTYNGFHQDWGDTQAAAWVDSLRLALSKRQREVLDKM